MQTTGFSGSFAGDGSPCMEIRASQPIKTLDLGHVIIPECIANDVTSCQKTGAAILDISQPTAFLSKDEYEDVPSFSLPYREVKQHWAWLVGLVGCRKTISIRRDICTRGDGHAYHRRVKCKETTTGEPPRCDTSGK